MSVGKVSRDSENHMRSMNVRKDTSQMSEMLLVCYVDSHAYCWSAVVCYQQFVIYISICTCLPSSMPL